MHFLRFYCSLFRFQNKYHPDHCKEVKAKALENVQKRLDVYNEVVSVPYAKDISFSFDNTEKIVRFLDAVVVKLEGGSEEDVNIVLNEPVDDEALTDLRNRQKKEENGDANGNNNGSAPAEYVESEQFQELLKRIPIRTHSIFLRGIPATAKYEDIEKEGKNYPGFLRLGLSDPLNDQKFQRRAYITYNRDVKIKDIFWNMKNAKVRSLTPLEEEKI